MEYSLDLYEHARSLSSKSSLVSFSPSQKDRETRILNQT